MYTFICVYVRGNPGMRRAILLRDSTGAGGDR